MSITAQRICIDLLSLPRESRLEIAERLLASLEDEADQKTEKSWRALVRRRHAEIHSGKAKERPAAEVMENALKAIS